MKYIFGDSFFSLSFLIHRYIFTIDDIIPICSLKKKKKEKKERERNVSRMTDEEVWRVANENVSASRVV